MGYDPTVDYEEYARQQAAKPSTYGQNGKYSYEEIKRIQAQQKNLAAMGPQIPDWAAAASAAQGQMPVALPFNPTPPSSDWLASELQKQIDAENAPAVDAPQQGYTYGDGGSGGGGGGDGGAASAAASLESQLSQIREQYATHQADLDRQKAQSLDSILQYGDKAKASIGANRADYATQAGNINGTIQKNYADAGAADAANRAAQAAENAKFGLNPGALDAVTAKGSSYLSQQGQAQGALGTRLQQVADQGFAAQQAGADEVRNAGQGQLENNYAQFKSKLDLQKMTAEASANDSYQSALRSAASGGGGGGGRSGGGTNENGLTAWQQAQIDRDYYKIDSGNSNSAYDDLPKGFDLSTLEEDSPAWQAAFRGTLSDAQDFISGNVDSGGISGDEGQAALRTLAGNYGSAKTNARQAPVSQKSALRTALMSIYKSGR